MKGFTISTLNDDMIRFAYYEDAAPQTVTAFHTLLPFAATYLHARESGNEIWTEDAPKIFCPQENSTIYTMPGEVVIAPPIPVRNKAAGFMGIYYGEGKGVDGCNIFARVIEEDFLKLVSLGDAIWRTGQQALQFAAWGSSDL